jgi:hypothetical protein
VGILAACLGTLKPLFNWFLDTARALTTGSQRSRKYGYGYGSNYNRNSAVGYLKQREADIHMRDISTPRLQNPSNKELYNVNVTSGHGACGSKSSGSASPTGEIERDNKSEDYILGRHHRGGIVRTTEVQIS